MWKGIIHQYEKWLPVERGEEFITLHEGNTPLIRAKNLEKLMPGVEIHLKFEGLHPTGSFKDRGMTMAVTKAKSSGAKAVICASTGNTSASAAAYAAKAGMGCIVIIPSGKIAMGKLAQAMMYGAEVLPINGNFDEALEMVKVLSEKHGLAMVNSINPYRLEGQKTGGFEICDQLGDAPDHLFIPVGNAGNISAYFNGFTLYHQSNRSNRVPQLHGYQAEGSAPLVKGHPIEKPETIATAIRIGNPASWKLAENAIATSKGHVDLASDADILEAFQLLAKNEGVFAEPASCISLAGLMKSYKEGRINAGEKAVLILTGNGLKDPDTALSCFDSPKAIDDPQDAIVNWLDSRE